MRTAETLAYLGGMVDGDGYLKITKSPPRRRGGNPYYGITVGLQQLMPGEAVRLFAATFEGRVMPPTSLPGRRPMSRCEVHARKAEAAVRRLVPYLVVKKSQALLLLEVARIRRAGNIGVREYFERLERLRRVLSRLHEGRWTCPTLPLPVHGSLSGYDRLGPPELGWTQDQVHAYLAGIMDSDGSFRVEKRQVRGMLHPHYRINIRCAQVAPSAAIDLLATTFGGRPGVRRAERPHARALATWSLHDRAAVPAIRRLLPHLIVKSDEAWLLVELRWLKAEGKKATTNWEHPNRWHNRVKMRKRCYSLAQVASFERIYRKIQSLHAGKGFEPVRSARPHVGTDPDGT